MIAGGECVNNEAQAGRVPAYPLEQFSLDQKHETRAGASLP